MRKVLPPLILGLLLLGGWEAAVRAFHIAPYLLPGPVAGAGVWFWKFNRHWRHLERIIGDLAEGRLPSGFGLKKNVSCMSRAGWSFGKLSLVKL